MLGIYRLAAQLVASQALLSSTELVSYLVKSLSFIQTTVIIVVHCFWVVNAYFLITCIKAP
jgi:hypothetical protein